MLIRIHVHQASTSIHEAKWATQCDAVLHSGTFNKSSYSATFKETTAEIISSKIVMPISKVRIFYMISVNYLFA